MSDRPFTNIGDDYMQSMMERVLVGDIILIAPSTSHDWGGCLFVVDEINGVQVRAHHKFQEVTAYVLFNDGQYTVKGRM